MILISREDYENYMGEEIPGEDFGRIAARASEAVEAAAGWQIDAMDEMELLSEFDWQQIRLACCAQMESLYLSGVESALDNGSGGSGYMIGKAQNIVYGGGSAASAANPGGLCSKAMDALVPTGLLYRGVAVR